MKFNRHIIIDRDGVINHLVLRNNGYYSPRFFKDFKLYDDVLETIEFLKNKSLFHVALENGKLYDIHQDHIFNFNIKQNTKIKYRDLLINKNVSKVSIIGVGMVATPGVTFRMFQALASQKINIQVISTSEIKISVLISSKNVKKALITLHKEFKLER